VLSLAPVSAQIFRMSSIRVSQAGRSYYSTPKRYIAGAMVEIDFDPHFSMEVDGLYRPLGYTFAGVEPGGELNSFSPAIVVTWEFPRLAKYRFRLPEFGRL
jgi:hypothetical protein